MAQKITLAASGNHPQTFEGGEKLLTNDLHDLGLDENADHMKITFDNDKAVSYSLCAGFIISLCTMMFWPFYILFYPCIAYGVKKWAYSRVAAVTDRQLVLKQGYYGCCCCCWNESTKSVPLDKITDLQVQQGCIQRCFDIREIRVETASATNEMPELRLIGLHNALETRTKILTVRDNQNFNGGNSANNSYNPLIQPQQQSTEQLQSIIANQHETMIQIKDVLTEMRSALVSMDNKMQQKNDGTMS
eukprot:CAMPEP_0201564970 /NCGR_PEP_ID=MMETSP0190_2-20130828/3735_1 /ASSEMBLY_ACC=CAM_ASM_000263 /TAXON_ID=37353 /ORGANISM="Rosalina sp." /LENGTH=246 /DNA_ID=CAMNT_0047981867 /DNA_START=43 /DNA_END=783 /DNA_ORIENTATION=+